MPTLMYTSCFALMCFECVLFSILVVPLPFGMKRRIFTFISRSPLVAKLQHGLKITFVFILLLFVDSINRVWRVYTEKEQAKQMGGAALAAAGSDRSEVQARKFYSERNMYLTGITLFMSFILNNTYVQILNTLRLEAEVKRLNGESDNGAADLAQAGDMGEIGGLREEIKKLNRDIDVLKEQSDGLSKEYLERLGNNFHVSDGTPKKDL